MAEYEKFFQKTVERYMEQAVIFETDTVKYNIEGVRQCQTDRMCLRKQEKILSEAVIYEMIVFACGKKKDITREHVEAVYRLLYRQSGKKVVLPYRTEAEISYEKLIIRKSFERENSIIWNQKISIKELMEKDGVVHILLPDEGNLTVRIFSIAEMEEKKRINC